MVEHGVTKILLLIMRKKIYETHLSDYVNDKLIIILNAFC